jgi:hypothetical protein
LQSSFNSIDYALTLFVAKALSNLVMLSLVIEDLDGPHEASEHVLRILDEEDEDTLAVGLFAILGACVRVRTP